MTLETILVIVLLVILVALFAVSFMKRKSVNNGLNQLREELKNGDKVMTDSGIVGEVVDSYVEDEYKYFVLKSGKGDKTGYFTVHANAIYYAFDKDGKTKDTTKEEKKVVVLKPKTEEKPAESEVKEKSDKE